MLPNAQQQGKQVDLNSAHWYKKTASSTTHKNTAFRQG